MEVILPVLSCTYAAGQRERCLDGLLVGSQCRKLPRGADAVGPGNPGWSSCQKGRRVRTANRWAVGGATRRVAVRFKRPSGRRTRLSRARLGKAAGVPRGADDPRGQSPGSRRVRPPATRTGFLGSSFSSSGHPHRASMPGSAFPRRCTRSVLRRPSRRCRPGRRLVVQPRPKGSPHMPSRSPPRSWPPPVAAAGIWQRRSLTPWASLVPTGSTGVWPATGPHDPDRAGRQGRPRSHHRGHPLAWSRHGRHRRPGELLGDHPGRHRVLPSPARNRRRQAAHRPRPRRDQQDPQAGPPHRPASQPLPSGPGGSRGRWGRSPSTVS